MGCAFMITEGVLPLVPPAACVALPGLTQTHGKSRLEGSSPTTLISQRSSRLTEVGPRIPLVGVNIYSLNLFIHHERGEGQGGKEGERKEEREGKKIKREREGRREGGKEEMSKGMRPRVICGFVGWRLTFVFKKIIRNPGYIRHLESNKA